MERFFRRLKGFLVKDVDIKLMALLLAIFFWIYVDLEVRAKYKSPPPEKKPYYQTKLPVNINLSPESPYFFEITPRMVNVGFDGPRNAIENLRRAFEEGKDVISIFIVATSYKDFLPNQSYKLPLYYKFIKKEYEELIKVELKPDSVNLLVKEKK
jgi:hypothetical protein